MGIARPTLPIAAKFCADFTWFLVGYFLACPCSIPRGLFRAPGCANSICLIDAFRGPDPVLGRTSPRSIRVLLVTHKGSSLCRSCLAACDNGSLRLLGTSLALNPV